jgi:hypothetical protein
MDKMPDLRPGASRQDLEKAMLGHVLKQGEPLPRIKVISRI